MMKMIKGVMVKIFLGLLLVVLITPQQALAVPKPSESLKLINNRSETVWVACSSWDLKNLIGCIKREKIQRTPSSALGRYWKNFCYSGSREAKIESNLKQNIYVYNKEALCNH